MQYTIRGIPPAVDKALRRRARASGKSLNEAAIEALAEAVGVTGAPRKYRDLSDIAGTWVVEPEVEAVLAEQREQIDEDLWK
jgi:plasmid stability protein